MHQSIGKRNKVTVYLIIFFILSTINNKTINTKRFQTSKIDTINVVGLSDNKNIQLINTLNNLFNENIFFINKEEINNTILKNNIIEEYSIQKIYPSKLNINIKPVKFLAKIYGNNKLLVGSNGKLIRVEIAHEILPLINGKFNPKEFLKLKENIDNSNFNLTEFKLITFYLSKRWDILTVDNILIKLPEKNLTKSLNFAHKIINKKHFKDYRIIDLRVANHLITK